MHFYNEINDRELVRKVGYDFYQKVPPKVETAKPTEQPTVDPTFGPSDRGMGFPLRAELTTERCGAGQELMSEMLHSDNLITSCGQ